MGCVFQNKTTTQSIKQKDPAWGWLRSCLLWLVQLPWCFQGQGHAPGMEVPVGARWEPPECISGRIYLCRIWPCPSTEEKVISRSNSEFTPKLKLFEGSAPQTGTAECATLLSWWHCHRGAVLGTSLPCIDHPLPTDGVVPWSIGVNPAEVL